MLTILSSKNSVPGRKSEKSTLKDIHVHEYLYCKANCQHEVIIGQHCPDVMHRENERSEERNKRRENEGSIERNNRLKAIAARLKQVRRRAAMVETFGPAAFYCLNWIPSRWITHTDRVEWNMVITFLREQRNWAEQQFEEQLQVPVEEYHQE
jgi:hypothetical protein